MAHAAGRDPFAGFSEADWQALARKQQEWLPLADACWELSGARAGDRVADVGCGPGVFARRYAELGGEVAAIDRQGEALARVPPTPRLRVVRHDASAGPLPGSPYDVLFLTDVLHHVPGATAVLRNLRASGPMLVVSETLPTSSASGHGQGHGHAAPRIDAADVVALLAGAGWRPGPVVSGQPFGHYSIVAR